MDRRATRCACARPTCSSTSLDEGLSERIRASILLAGPLLARFGSADVPLPGGDVIGRRRVDSHLLALAALGAEVDGRPHLSLPRPGRPQGHRVPPRRGLGHRDRERAHGRRAGRGPDDDPQRGLRAARAGSLPPARRDGRRDRGHRLEPAARARRSRRSAAPRTSSAPITSRSARSSAWRRSRAATSRSPTASPTTCARRCSRSSASACASRSTAATCACRPARTWPSWTTRTTRSRRSTTARGRPSRPT